MGFVRFGFFLSQKILAHYVIIWVQNLTDLKKPKSVAQFSIYFARFNDSISTVNNNKMDCLTNTSEESVPRPNILKTSIQSLLESVRRNMGRILIIIILYSLRWLTSKRFGLNVFATLGLQIHCDF